jgi:hypothetical protein
MLHSDVLGLQLDNTEQQQQQQCTAAVVHSTAQPNSSYAVADHTSEYSDSVQLVQEAHTRSELCLRAEAYDNTH